jgi:histidinol dehydrogenase
MRRINYPEKQEWKELLARPDETDSDIEASVLDILNTVRKKGDEALFEYTRKFDGCDLNNLRCPQEMIDSAEVSDELKDAIHIAASNIRKFHESQSIEESPVETMPGVICYRKSLPIEKVGLYIPGGTAPLFSSLLMLAIPAQIAGVKEIVVCSPPDKDGEVSVAIRYTAKILGITNLYLVGGAQAIAAMTYGTATIPKVDKIFGPGNMYVTKAKQKAMMQGIAIDMPAGPSEVLVVTDATSNASFAASDLLSQAEHGTDSQVILLVSDESGNADEFLQEIDVELQNQLAALPRKEIAAKALTNSRIIRFKTEAEAMQFSNEYAPEHLILATLNPNETAKKVRNAGSVFIGKWSCESAGDYASGTNHTLPTHGYARAYSGVSVDSFVKKVTFQELTQTGILNLGPSVERMAEAEGLQAHKNAVTIRLKSARKL